MKIKHLTLLAVVAFAGLQPQAKAQVVDLGSASSFAVLAGAAVNNASPTTQLYGDLGLSPASALTCFPPGTVSGAIHAGDPVAAQAQLDLTTAYNYTAGRAGTILGSELGGSTLFSGVWTAPPSFQITGDLKLDAQGDPNAVWIFQMPSSTLTTAVGSKVILLNGAQAGNVFWQVGSSATIGVGADFSGSILAYTSITLGNGADVLGRLLAQNGAVTLDNNLVAVPEPAGTFVLFAGLSGLVIGVRRIRRHSQNPAH